MRDVGVVFVPSDDRLVQSAVLAEIAICGGAPAIVNAIDHATGTRVRELPVTLDKLLRFGG